MKKIDGNKVISIVTVCVVAAVIALVWVLGLAGLDSEPDKETGEIRQLAEFPKEYSNDLFAKINTFMNDHSPMRNSIISAVNGMDRSMSDFYNDHIMDPIYDALAKVKGTPDPNATQGTEPTPDFGDLFGDETEGPTAEPTPYFTPEPTPPPTTEPVSEPTPTPTPFEGERVELIACWLDTIMVDDVANFGLGDGSAIPKISQFGRILDNSEGIYSTLLFRGWAGFTKEIESFGYKLGDAEPVFSQDWFTPEESAVRDAAGEYARRFSVQLSLEGIKGDNPIFLAVRFATGEVFITDTDHGDITFTIRGKVDPEQPVMFDSSNVTVSADRDVMLNAYSRSILELDGKAAAEIASGMGDYKYVQFILKDCRVAVDKPGFGALASALKNGSNLTFSAKEINASELNEAQKNAISDKIVSAIFSIEVLAGENRVTSLGGGRAEVSFKYQKPSDVESENIRVARLTDSGTLEPVSAVYDEGTVTFTAKHLSEYVIYVGNGETDVTPTPGPGESTSCDHDYAVVREQEATFAHDGYVLERCTKCGNGKVSNVVLRTSLPGFFNSRRPITYEGAGFKGIHDWYFYAGDNSVGYYQGDNVLSEDECAAWASIYEELHQICEEKGIKVAFLIPPNKEQVYGEYMPSGLTVVDDSAKREPVFVKYLKEHNSPIHYVYPLSQLKSGKILYETYLQQDTHWNSVGGFIGAMQVYASLGMPTTGLQNVEVELTDYASGDLVSLGVGPASHYTGYSVNYKPEITVTQTYSYSNNVVGGNVDPNSELRILESDASTTAKAVIIGDSFRHAIAPYIAKDFSKVTVTHRGDFYTVSSTVMGPDGQVKESGETVMQNALRELEAGDLLLIMAVERYDQSNVDMARLVIDFFAAIS